MQRIETIDIAKAICIILVVIGHFNPDYAPIWYALIIKFIYVFHMPVFMFASGYVYMLGYRKTRYGEFATNKFRRLMIPYFAISILIIGLKILGSTIMPVQHPVSLLSFIEMFYFPVAGYFLWFCWALFIIFLIVRPFGNGRLLSAVAIFSVIIFFALESKDITNIFALNQIVRMLPYFMAGILTFRYKNRIIKIINAPSYTAWLGFAAIVVYTTFDTDNQILQLFIPVIGIFSIYKISQAICNSNRTILMRVKKHLLKIADASYVIYLLHTTIEGFVKGTISIISVGGVEWWTSSLKFTFVAAIIIVCGTVIPYMLYYHILTKHRITRFFIGKKSI